MQFIKTTQNEGCQAVLSTHEDKTVL